LSFVVVAAAAAAGTGLVIASDVHGWPVALSAFLLAVVLLSLARAVQPPRPTFPIIGALVGGLCALALGFALVKGGQPSQDGLFIYGGGGFALGVLVGVVVWSSRA
jgi:hypothetical protein